MIVENDDGTKMDGSSYSNEVFCLKCYPSVYNFTRGLVNATRYDLSILLDLNNVDSCDEKLGQKEIKDKVITKLQGQDSRVGGGDFF